MRTKVFIRLSCAAAVLLAAACGPRGNLDRSTRELLGELDGYVAARDVYVARKLDQMDALRKLCGTINDPERRYELEMNIAEEFFAFSFDSTQAYLKHCQELALDPLKDRERYNRASIQLGHLYSKAGNYLEANSLLYGQIDTSTLSEALMTEYLYTLYDFSNDLAGNSGMVERLSIPPAASFRQRLLDRLPKDSDRWRTLLRDRLTAEDRLASADSVARLLLAGTRPEEHAYAIYAFHLSDIAERDGRPEDRMAWLIRSAESDLVNAVRDYASLTMVAQNIVSSDVDRSFRYLRIAQEDALAYNAKLRPWQISRFLMQVEDAYSARQARSRTLSIISSILLAILVLTLSVIAWFLVSRSRKLTRLRAQLESNNAQLASANAELSVLNKRISKADKVGVHCRFPPGPFRAGCPAAFGGQPFPKSAEAGQVRPAVQGTRHFRAVGAGLGRILPQIRRDLPGPVSRFRGAVQRPPAGGSAHRSAQGKAYHGAPDLRPDPPRIGRFQEDRGDAGLLRQHHL